MAKKKQGRSQKRRSEKKILDAFHLAERGVNGNDDSDSDNDDLQVRDGVMDARKFMKNQEDDDDFDDEELDSDEALNSDDDYDVLNSKFSQTIRDKRKNKTGEDSDSEYDSIDESQLVTLSEAWDLDEKPFSSRKTKGTEGPKPLDVVLDDNWQSESSESELESEKDSDSDNEGQHSKHTQDNSNDEEESGSEEDSGDSDSSEDSEEDSEDSEDEERMLRGSDDEDEIDMSNTLSSIKAHLKQEPEHKRLITETIKENEFGIPSRGAKLSLAEMLGNTDASEAALISKDDTEDMTALSVPLPKRIQERNDRRVAYEITKEEVNKWEETVRAIRDSDQLQFPLAPPATEEQEEVDAEREYDSLRIVPENNGKSEIENKINEVLRAGALLDESKEATFEQIAAAKLSKEDMFKRTQELRRMRELMFRDEQRAKRIKKIKSKQFRKIRKRESLRDAALVEGSDAESSDEDHDRKRAEERMSLRHKTQSKWAKTMIKSGITKDASSRAELEEMLRAGERLRTKQLGYNDGEKSDNDVSDIEKDYENDNYDEEDEERAKLGKGVLAMDFMKAAEERKRKENKREIELLKNMKEGNGMEDLETEARNSINQSKNQGRRVYTPSAKVAREEAEEAEEELLHDFRDDEARTLEKQMRGKERTLDGQDDADSEPPAKKHKIIEEEFTGFDDEDSEPVNEKEQTSQKKKSRNPLSSHGQDDSDEEENPWLNGFTETTEKSKKYHAITEDSSRLSKAANKIQKNADKRQAKSKSNDTIVDLNNTMNISKNVQNSEDEDEDDGESRMFLQKNLISEAFAGDDVVSEFQEEKRRIVEEEDDKTEDMTLPGWGGWGGADITKAPKKKFVRKIDGVMQKDKRKDKDLKNVIVNETLNKHNLKYQSSSVPFPYESREQYERALRMPIGEEWTSKATHKKATQPRIVVKRGHVVDPLKAPFK